jgi:hypothetical protein
MLKMAAAFVAGAGYVTLLSRPPLRQLSEAVDSVWFRFAVPSVLIFIMSRPVAALCRKRRELEFAGVVALLGVCAGVLGDVIYDSYFNNIAHNLFPFEIIAFVVVGSPGIMFGFLPNWPDE